MHIFSLSASFVARPILSCGVCLLCLRSCIVISPFRTKRYGNIPTATPLRGASSAGGVSKNIDFLPIPRFISETIQNRTKILPGRFSNAKL